MDWRELHHFWFGTLTHGQSDDAHKARWFEANRDFDAACAEGFESWLPFASRGELTTWLQEPAACLTFIILTDQIPRNVYRGTSAAFDWDHLALDAARSGVERELDVALGWDERAFFYMPFEHSEKLLDQHLAVGLFTALRDASPRAMRNSTGNSLRFAQQHRDVIATFGRFPHRNAALNRESSAAELDYIKDSDGFGQTVATD